MHETCKWRKRDISGCQLPMGSVDLFDSDKAASESVAAFGWHDFLKPELFQKGKLAVLVLLSAPPKICCLCPNGDMGTQDSRAAGDPANPDLSRWTCERLQFSIDCLEQGNDVLFVLSCCHRGVSTAFSNAPWCLNIWDTQLFMHGVRTQPFSAQMEGLLLTQDMGKISRLGLFCWRKSQGCFEVHRFSLPVVQAPTLIAADSPNWKTKYSSSTDSVFTFLLQK